jgi:hypothetical protein
MGLGAPPFKFPRRVRRTRPEVQRRLLAIHARHTGEIMMAWNDLQSALFSFFVVLIGKDKQHMAHGIWHVIQSDKTQREMLLAAAKVEMARWPYLLAELKWILDRTNELSPHRNDAAHTAIWGIVVSIDKGMKRELTPDLVASRWQSIQRLTETPTAKIWRAVRGDLYALSGYTAVIQIRLSRPLEPPHTFPARPQLQAVRPKSDTRSPTPNARKRARPPKS